MINVFSSQFREHNFLPSLLASVTFPQRSGEETEAVAAVETLSYLFFFSAQSLP